MSRMGRMRGMAGMTGRGAGPMGGAVVVRVAVAGLFGVALSLSTGQALADIAPLCCDFAGNEACGAGCPDGGGSCQSVMCTDVFGSTNTMTVAKCFDCPPKVVDPLGQCTMDSQIGQPCGDGGTCRQGLEYACNYAYIQCVGPYPPGAVLPIADCDAGLGDASVADASVADASVVDATVGDASGYDAGHDAATGTGNDAQFEDMADSGGSSGGASTKGSPSGGGCAGCATTTGSDGLIGGLFLVGGVLLLGLSRKR
jgi:hypothetical protein